MTVTEPGFYPDLAATYHSAQHTPTEALSQSGIKTLLQETPFDFKNPSEKKSAEMDFGAIVHTMALGKGALFSVSPYDDYRTNIAKAWRDETIAEGRIPIKADKFADADKIASVIRSRVVQLLDGEPYETEVPFFWLEGETWCRGMADIWCESKLTAIDPKITGRVGKMARAHIVNQGWDIQAAWYRRGLEKILPQHAGRIRFVNLLVKPDAPFTSRAIMLNEAFRQSAEAECERGLRIFQRCMATGEWPGYGDEIELLDAPSWTLKERMETELLEDEAA